MNRSSNHGGVGLMRCEQQAIGIDLGHHVTLLTTLVEALVGTAVDVTGMT